MALPDARALVRSITICGQLILTARAMIYGLLRRSHVAALRDVETVEELTDILVLDERRLLELGGDEGDLHNVVALELELVLDITRSNELDGSRGGDLEHVLLAEEVADLDSLAVKVDVDGVVVVHEAHLVLETPLDTRDRVGHVTGAGADAGELLAAAEPHVKGDLVAILGDVDGKVLEVTHEGAAGASDGDNAGLDGDLNALRDGNGPARSAQPASQTSVVRQAGAARGGRRGRRRGRTWCSKSDAWCWSIKLPTGFREETVALGTLVPQNIPSFRPEDSLPAVHPARAPGFSFGSRPHVCVCCGGELKALKLGRPDFSDVAGPIKPPPLPLRSRALFEGAVGPGACVVRKRPPPQ
jgi:hypothetical protein